MKFLFVAEDQVMDSARRQGALPFGGPGVYDALDAYCRAGRA
jgi:hypothetical protein